MGVYARFIDIDLPEVDISNAAMVIIPGANVFIKSDVPELVPLIRACSQNKIPIAAICGGTLLLARNGFLDTVKHTSLGPKWLKRMAPSYLGEVREIMFTSRVFPMADLLRQASLATWNLHTTSSKVWRYSSEYLEVWLTAYKKGYANLDPFLGIDSK